jgi:putative glycosyltransferase (TIGR04372 family)
MDRLISLYELKQLYLKDMHIVLYGAGVNGKKMYIIMKKYGIGIHAFVDQKQEHFLIEGDECNAVSPNDIQQSDIIIITPENKNVRNEIENTLGALGRTNFYYLDCNWQLLGMINAIYPKEESLKIEELETTWKTIKQNYAAIKAYRMWSTRIGEVIYRFRLMKRAFREEDNCYHIVIPYREEGVNYANERLMRILGRYIHLVDCENAGLWRYVFESHASDIDLSQLNHFDNYEEINISLHNSGYLSDIEFSEEELKEAESKWKKLNIDKEYVCVFARDSYYLDHQFHYEKGHFAYHNYIDFDIRTFDKLADYLDSNNIAVVRVGNGSNTEYQRENVYDFSKKENYDELLDLYILSNCKYWIGGMSGACLIPNLFGKRMIFVNYPLIAGFLCCIGYEFDEQIYSLKLYYDKNNDRILSIREILKLNRDDQDAWKYEERYGIVLIDNTPEEILQVYIEADKRFNNQWEDSEEEAALQKKYENIMEEFRSENPYYVYQGTKRKIDDCLLPLKMSSSFLRMHPELVED